MKVRVLAVAAIAVLVLSIAGLTSADSSRTGAKARQTSRLLSLMPASDGVAVFDTRRFFNEALPRILSANQPVLNQITARIDQMQADTGIDLRKFDQIAVGVAYKQVSGKETNYEPLVIAGGDINAGALLAVAKLASKGTYREEKVANHSVFVFVPKAVIQKTKVNTTNSKITNVIDDALQGLSKEIAVSAVDSNTLVMGTVGRVREALDSKSRVSADLTSLLSQRESAVASFAFRSPGVLSKWLPMDNDQLGVNLGSIQLICGSLEVAAGATILQLTAKTRTADQAQNLKETLDGLQMVGKAFLSRAKRPDQQVYSHMINNVKIAVRGTELSLDLTVPQSDIDILVAGIK